MINLIRTLFSLLTLKKVTLTVICIAVIFFSRAYIADIIPFSFLHESTFDKEENVATNITKEIIIKKGDTLGTILRKQKLPSQDIQKIIALAKNKKLVSNLKIGSIFSFHYNIELIKSEDPDLNQEILTLSRAVLHLDKINAIEFVRQNDTFTAHYITEPLKKLITQYKTNISSSLMHSLQKSGTNTASIVKLIDLYSHQIDFQRQIRSGDKITVIIEKFVTSRGEFSHYGQILYASLATQGGEYNIYRYCPDGDIKNNTLFFSENGNSIKNNLLRTPVKVARISGHFGYRKKHPVLGYGAMHKGVDFAAATGTPIYAAGNGIVEFVGWKSGYGRFILIKHNGSIATAYAHASKFASNLKKGNKVEQGDIIAYVGRSGRTTGPHLHYEVRINGKQVNPLKIKSTPDVKLTGKQLEDFKRYSKGVKYFSNRIESNTDIDISDAIEIQS